MPTISSPLSRPCGRARILDRRAPRGHLPLLHRPPEARDAVPPARLDGFAGAPRPRAFAALRGRKPRFFRRGDAATPHPSRRTGSPTGSSSEALRYAFVHGDRVNTADLPYRFWRRVSKNPVARAALDVIPGGLARAIVAKTEARLYRSNFRHKKRLPEEALRAEGRAARAQGYDALLVGHFHVGRTFAGPDGVTHVLPAWLEERKHAEIAPDGRLSIVEEPTVERARRRGFGALEADASAARVSGAPLLRGRLAGTLRVPGSKSVTNRALLAAACADGESVLLNPLESSDTRALAAALRLLGAEIFLEGVSWRVRGPLRPRGDSAPELLIDVGDAGTPARFLVGAPAAVPGRFVLDGSARMRERPMSPLFEAIRTLGGEIRCLGREGYLPGRDPRRHAARRARDDPRRRLVAVPLGSPARLAPRARRRGARRDGPDRVRRVPRAHARTSSRVSAPSRAGATARRATASRATTPRPASRSRARSCRADA